MKHTATFFNTFLCGSKSLHSNDHQYICIIRLGLMSIRLPETSRIGIRIKVNNKKFDLDEVRLFDKLVWNCKWNLAMKLNNLKMRTTRYGKFRENKLIILLINYSKNEEVIGEIDVDLASVSNMVSGLKTTFKIRKCLDPDAELTVFIQVLEQDLLNTGLNRESDQKSSSDDILSPSDQNTNDFFSLNNESDWKSQFQIERKNFEIKQAENRISDSEKTIQELYSTIDYLRHQLKVVSGSSINNNHASTTDSSHADEILELEKNLIDSKIQVAQLKTEKESITTRANARIKELENLLVDSRKFNKNSISNCSKKSTYHI